MADDASPRSRRDDHPGLDNDEATDEGKMMTAQGSVGEPDPARDPPTIDDHPGLDDDEATGVGKMMTAEGSIGAGATDAKPGKDHRV